MRREPNSYQEIPKKNPASFIRQDNACDEKEIRRLANIERYQ